ncbi:hypothetical protein HZA97_03295 [Candidatus Woesearchaeota archaeon]|nr:hypothetical protein [Candidatus Woesearchaeota archaeon]
MKDKKKIFASLFIAFIMVFSIFGFILSYTLGEESVKYQGHKFVKTPQGWLSIINDERLFFSFNPQEVDFFIKEEIKQFLKDKKKLTLSYNPKDFYSSAITEVALKLYQDLPKIKETKINFGLTNNTGYDLPLITCNNASAENPVLIFEENDFNASIELENNCIKLKYTTQLEVLQQGDAIFYTLAGMI